MEDVGEGRWGEAGGRRVGERFHVANNRRNRDVSGHDGLRTGTPKARRRAIAIRESLVERAALGDEKRLDSCGIGQQKADNKRKKQTAHVVPCIPRLSAVDK